MELDALKQIAQADINFLSIFKSFLNISKQIWIFEYVWFPSCNIDGVVQDWSNSSALKNGVTAVLH